MTSDNDTAIEAWNTILFEKFCRFRHILTTGLSVHSDEALRRRPFLPGAKVLDVGCGFGDTTRLIAERVGARGSAVGVDCAANFIALASAEARELGPPSTAFMTADVQVDELGGPYDAAFSRFGTMFFNLPGAALRNIRRSLRPGGPFTMVVWRKREDNPWLHDAERRVREIIPVVSREETDQVHCGPGPFSMSGPDLVSDLMQLAGFREVTFERFDADICIGRDLAEALDFAMAIGPAGEIIRLAGEEGESRKPQVVSALREALSAYQRRDEIWAPSSAWFVSARAGE